MTIEHSNCRCCQESEEDKRARIIEIIDDNKGGEGSLIRILHLTQGVYGYLPLDVQQLIAERMDIPVSEVTGVSSFYSFFSTQPRGEFAIQVCMGTACYVRGGAKILKRLSELLGVEVGCTTSDRKYSLQVVRCMGACGLAPAIMINGKVIPQVNPDKLDRVLEECK